MFQKFHICLFILEKKKTRPESVDCTPPDYIMPGSKERPLLPLHPVTKESKGPQCIKVFFSLFDFFQCIVFMYRDIYIIYFAIN